MYNNIFLNSGTMNDLGGDDHDFWSGCFTVVCYMIVFIAASVVCFFLSACSPRVVESITVRTDTVWQHKVQRDSVVLKDSVHVREWVRGDTVRIETTRWRDRWRDRVVTDTAYISRSDTVRVVSAAQPRNTLSGWQWFQIWAGRLAMLAIAATLAVVVFRRYVRQFLP